MQAAYQPCCRLDPLVLVSLISRQGHCLDRAANKECACKPLPPGQPPRPANRAYEPAYEVKGSYSNAWHMRQCNGRAIMPVMVALEPVFSKAVQPTRVIHVRDDLYWQRMHCSAAAMSRLRSMHVHELQEFSQLCSPKCCAMEFRLSWPGPGSVP